MKNKIIAVIIFVFLVLPVISADPLDVRYKGININNQITNIQDFPDYVFVVYGKMENMCPIKVVKENGEIGYYYKFCNPSVYAIPKENFNELNENYILKMQQDYRNFTGEEVLVYITSIGGKEVIKNIQTSTNVPEASTITEINNSYIIDINKVLTKPNNTITPKNNLIYFYILIPLIALILIVFIIYKRRK